MGASPCTACGEGIGCGARHTGQPAGLGIARLRPPRPADYRARQRRLAADACARAVARCAGGMGRCWWCLARRRTSTAVRGMHARRAVRRFVDLMGSGMVTNLIPTRYLMGWSIRSAHEVRQLGAGVDAQLGERIVDVGFHRM